MDLLQLCLRCVDVGYTVGEWEHNRPRVLATELTRFLFPGIQHWTTSMVNRLGEQGPRVH